MTSEQSLAIKLVFVAQPKLQIIVKFLIIIKRLELI